MIRRPPRSTLDRSSAASDVYKRQEGVRLGTHRPPRVAAPGQEAVSYTHLRAHETGRNLVCRLLLEKKKKKNKDDLIQAERRADLPTTSKLPNPAQRGV